MRAPFRLNIEVPKPGLVHGVRVTLSAVVLVPLGYRHRCPVGYLPLSLPEVQALPSLQGRKQLQKHPTLCLTSFRLIRKKTEFYSEMGINNINPAVALGRVELCFPIQNTRRRRSEHDQWRLPIIREYFGRNRPNFPATNRVRH